MPQKLKSVELLLDPHGEVLKTKGKTKIFGDRDLIGKNFYDDLMTPFSKILFKKHI